jgi:hypothetical protein
VREQEAREPSTLLLRVSGTDRLHHRRRRHQAAGRLSGQTAEHRGRWPNPEFRRRKNPGLDSARGNPGLGTRARQRSRRRHAEACLVALVLGCACRPTIWAPVRVAPGSPRVGPFRQRVCASVPKREEWPVGGERAGGVSSGTTILRRGHANAAQLRGLYAASSRRSGQPLRSAAEFPRSTHSATVVVWRGGHGDTCDA